MYTSFCSISDQTESKANDSDKNIKENITSGMNYLSDTSTLLNHKVLIIYLSV